MPAPPLVRLPRPVGGTLDERSDDELMTLAQAGERAAFAVLVARHAERVIQTCARFANDPDVGADLAQETWVAVWVRRAQYRGEGRFVVWLITVARNHCRNHVRGRGVAHRHAMTDSALGEAPSPDQIDALLVAERRRHVREGLARLPEPMREALLLRYAEELRYDEMVEVASTGESTLRSRVHHGLKQLRKFLEGGR